MRYFIIFISILVSIQLLGDMKGSAVTMMEICDNALDDDGDGLVDLNDDDCGCNTETPSSLIPNPSFEDQNCCPQGRSELNCASDWIQASLPTTDYIHNCGFPGWDNIPTPKPFPDGDGIVGFRDGRNIMGVREPNWKEYAGACLLSPLKEGVEYTFQFNLGFANFSISPPINLSFFGTPTCDDLPFGQNDEFLGCPTNDVGGDWSLLNARNIQGTNWVTSTITITPKEDIYAIAVGPSCAKTSSSVNLYYFFDNLILAETRLFQKTVTSIGNSCQNDFILRVEPTAGASYQWYEDGIALIGETAHELIPSLVDGNYAVMEIFEGQCNLSKTYEYKVPEYTTVIKEIICEDEIYQLGEEELITSGNYMDTMTTSDGCDSIIHLDLTVLGQIADTVIAKIFRGEEYEIANFNYSDEGRFDLSLLSSLGCDSLIHLDLQLYDVYIPNVFTPNDDGLNDIFEIFVEDPLVNVASVKIKDRWGNLVFSYSPSTSDITLGWDGSLLGNEVSQGVYHYQIHFNVENDTEKYVNGDLTLLK